MSRTIIVLLGMCVVCAPVIADEPAPKEQDSSYWMSMKLDYTGKILEGMANGDFEQIVKQAQGMRFLNAVEGFVRQRPAGYRTQLRAFGTAIAEIESMAKDENLDGVTIAFHQLTVSCVQCHKKMRQSDQGSTPRTAPQPPPQPNRSMP